MHLKLHWAALGPPSVNDWPILPPNGSPKPTRFIKLISDIVKILHLVNKWDHNLLIETPGPTNPNNISQMKIKTTKQNSVVFNMIVEVLG